MRAGANRAFGYAILASILLHALLLLALPSLRGFVELQPSAPVRLTARMVEIAPAPAAAHAPKPKARPQARPPAARPAPVPAPAPEPIVQTPLPEPAPRVARESSPPPAAPISPAVAGALARIETRPAPSASPAPDTAAQDHYRVSLNIAAARFKRYPRAAIDNSWEGEVVVLMTIAANGRIASLRVRSSSGYEILDRQALDMFRNAKTFVPIPLELRGREFELELRAIYGLRDQGSG